MLRVLSTPALFSLELTSLCNSRCSGCYNVFVEDRHALSVPIGQRAPLSHEQWQALMSRLAPYAHRFKLTGGEPTLHPEFEAIIGHVRDLGTPLTVFTNGRWPNPERVVDALARTANLVGLLVSLHGVHAASHEAFSDVCNSFEETIANIKYAISAGLPVTLSAVLHQANLDELPDLVALAQSLGADHVVFNRYLGSIPEITITDVQLIQATQTIDAMRQQGLPVTFGNCIPQCFTRSSSNGCLAGVAFCAVDPWGNLRPCNHSPLTAGNLLEVTLEAAWHSPEMERFRQAIPEACHTCAAFSTCHGGCKALAMELDLPGDPLMNKPLDEFTLPVVQMARNWRPVGQFQIRQEPLGLVLMHGNAILLVRHEADSILRRLDGTHTLAELEQVLGTAEMSLIGELFHRNMVEMRA